MKDPPRNSLCAPAVLNASLHQSRMPVARIWGCVADTSCHNGPSLNNLSEVSGKDDWIGLDFRTVDVPLWQRAPSRIKHLYKTQLLQNPGSLSHFSQASNSRDRLKLIQLKALVCRHTIGNFVTATSTGLGSRW